MDFLVELVLLGVDSIILITCIKQYYHKKNAISRILSAPTLAIDSNLKEIIRSHPESKLPLIAIRGAVKPLGNPISSNNSPNVSGVIQSLQIKEHVVQRSAAGFWADSEWTIQDVCNVTPFGLESKGIVVEVADPLVSEYLDMDVISDTFRPTVPSMMDHIWGFFTGFRQRGVQSTEKMLRCGTVVTGIGELIYERDGTLKLQPPTTGGSYYLTTLPVDTLLKKIKISKRNYGVMILIFGTLGAVVAGIVIRKYWKQKKQLKDAEERKVIREQSRKNRRRLIRDSKDLSDNKVCVVCRSNPIEIILLPCGHVCLCEDCADDITSSCPVCRATIEMKSAAYVV
ncbi:unnamed protein product [Ceutorhynchus assimilis]|uniref:RING-type E3 ubiquitin transferase n=1 Tax=Ceutorhynchus assimilis TaxID=467358 RepID=A0A9N9MH00_9CUCU|nr:unnamed protein product [Ceutorhynchus assimilis]